MAETGGSKPLEVRDLHKTFARGKGRVEALRGISFDLEPGSVNALLGPDGAGKTTLIRLATGVMAPDRGTVTVLGMDSVKEARDIQAAIGYMPQRFGLYEDLTVQENLDLYADLQGVGREVRGERYQALMDMTNLAPFTGRLAGRLSGGMKQKLGLACSLLKTPRFLLLDEPTVGVDPLSRRELWSIVDALVRKDNITVLVSTAYLDEAARCDRVFILQDGDLIGQGTPDSFIGQAQGRTWRVTPGTTPRVVQSRLFGKPEIADATLESGRVRVVTRETALPETLFSNAEALDPKSVAPVFEDGFMLLLNRDAEAEAPALNVSAVHGRGDGTAIRVTGLERRFGDFYAVKGLEFSVKRGEIFGLLGPNGAGKSTTFRMLCGLLPATGGTLEVGGLNLRRAAAKARKNLGYMAQKFSLYGQLSVRENLDFFSKVYGLSGPRREERVQWALQELDLANEADATSGELPFGFRQRLSLACALMHEPDILFLDEPTSGVDPLARRQFWARINSLAEQGVTVVVTTHFMEEAEYCDRMLIMMAGELLAQGTPDEIRKYAGKDGDATIEEAFIALVEEHRARQKEA
ncbi:ABC transporter related protein [Pseudodesulfovibrio mercurii]|uniref:ABC transporter related protein n=1 Tax=Pseudodesulfovibrio mercurii TaxID=641491 RepID=F0JCW2_9BACT|nr:ATP-binding cassette domain-containing protein [Pseudodesulfovibrio mercurii]EGB13290.1 ABC transporter related protein [Pseudodesulfovibrio mercurii]